MKPMNEVTLILQIYGDKNHSLNFLERMKKTIHIYNRVALVYTDEGLDSALQSAFRDVENTILYRHNCPTEWAKVCNCLIKNEKYSKNDILIMNVDVMVHGNFLDAMQQALYAAEKHGVVSPRMNSGKFVNIPKRFDSDINSMPFEVSYNAWDKARNLLPNYTVIPWVEASCLLIKREVLDVLGLFDEGIQEQYNAVLDYCIRLNKYGYSSIMSNQAFAYHEELFSKDEQCIDQSMLRRHQNLEELEQAYWERLIPIEYFARLFSDTSSRKKVLLNVCSMTSFHSGTTEYQKNLLKEFCSLYSDKYEIYILVNELADKFHGISSKYKNVFYPDTLKEVFHIGLFASQIVNVNDIKTMNKHCLRYTFTLQDIIFLRRSYMMVKENVRIDKVLRMAMQYADGIIGISEYSINDALSYFGDHIGGEDLASKSRVVYDAVDNNIDEVQATNYPASFSGDYALIFGRDSHYKLITEALELATTLPNLNFVVVGLDSDNNSYSNVKCHPSGHLSEDMIDSLYANAKLVIFPSLYEGFGIPVFDAFRYGKKVIVKNNELNREFAKNFKDAARYMVLYKDLQDLRSLISKEMCNNDILSSYHARSWRDVAVETESFLSELLTKPINVTRLNDRWHCISNLGSNCGNNKLSTKEFLEIVKLYTKARIKKVKRGLGIKL